MANEDLSQHSKNFRFNFGLLVFTLVAGFFLFTEHKAHILGLLTEHKIHLLNALPYLLLLLCPLMHIFMHGGGHGHGHDDKK